MKERDEYKEAAEARIGADRMAVGLSCIPDSVRGDMEEITRLCAQRDKLLAAAKNLQGFFNDRARFTHSNSSVSAINEFNRAIAEVEREP